MNITSFTGCRLLAKLNPFKTWIPHHARLEVIMRPRSQVFASVEKTALSVTPGGSRVPWGISPKGSGLSVGMSFSSVDGAQPTTGQRPVLCKIECSVWLFSFSQALSFFERNEAFQGATVLTRCGIVGQQAVPEMD